MSRPRCPFYGFHWPGNSPGLQDSGGSECALDFERNGPCGMERQGRPPDYDVCPMADRLRPIVEACLRNVVVYPAELAREGVSLEDWKRQVMTRTKRHEGERGGLKPTAG